MGAHVVWAQPDELATERQARAGIGAVEAGDQVEARRLAGAVRPDQCDRLAFADGKVENLDRAQAAEALANVAYDECFSHRGSLRARAPGRRARRVRTHP